MSPSQIHLSLMFWRMNLIWAINRFSHRPSNIDFDILEIKRAIYRIDLLRTIEAKDLVINIDEWTISRNTHQKYSWSLKRKKAEMRTIIFDKSVPLISEISSDGCSFTHLHKINHRLLKVLRISYWFEEIHIDQMKNKRKKSCYNTW